MKNTIPPIKAEIDYLEENKREIFCVGDGVQTSIESKVTPVRLTSIRHDGATVSNSPYFDGNTLNAEKILSNLHLLLSTSKELFSTRPALCAQYAVLLIEIDHAIVRLNIDKNILKSATIRRWSIDYGVWADKIKEAGKNWGYKDFRETDDVCYFNPGFDYKLFLDEHETFYQAFQDKVDALVKILKEMQSYVNGKVIKRETIDEQTALKSEGAKGDSVYVSYPWTLMEEIDDMCRAFDKARLSYKRDINDCLYRHNIRQFEIEIGNGSKVLAFINDDYLRSVNCMYELARVFQNGNTEKRLFPVVSFTGNRGSDMLKELHEFWDKAYQDRKKVLNELPSGVNLQVIDELSCCDTIIRELPKIVSYLSQVNTLSYEKLKANDYDLLIRELKRE